MKNTIQKSLTGLLLGLLASLCFTIPTKSEELNTQKTAIDLPIEYSQADNNTNEFQPDDQIYGGCLQRGADGSEAEESGVCGAQIIWQFTDGTLTITGSGRMYDYPATPPWYRFCDEIIRIEIAEGITYIGEAAFYECSSLTHISLPASLTEIGTGAFVRCYALKQAALPAKLVKIGAYAFQKSGLTELYLPHAVSFVGEYAFSMCESLNKATLSGSISKLQKETFYNCKSLQTVSLPGSLKQIGESVFYGCVALKSVKIPDSVTNIGNGAFYGCTLLKKVKLPSKLKNIGKNTFSRGTKAKNLPDEISQIEDGSLWKAAKVKINVKESYKAAFEVLKIVNQERKKQKQPALKMDKELLDAAMLRAAEISLYFNHVRPIGTVCFSCSELMQGENIAAGQRGAAEVMNSWMNSTGHRENILNSRWKGIGIGCVEMDGRKYWVQCFGEKLSSTARQVSYKEKSKKRTICVDLKYLRKVSKISLSSDRIGVGSAADVHVRWNNQFVTVSVPAEYLEYKSMKKAVCKVSKGKIKGKKAGSTKVKIWFPGYKKGAVTKKITVG